MDNDVFISYSHKDRDWLEKLQVMLKPLIRNNPISVWDDTKIRPGKNWKQEIETALNNAELAVLLVSQNFLASDFIADKEVPHLLDAAQQKGLTIIWIPITDCLWSETEIGHYQAAHNPEKPLDSLSPSELNRALVAICKEIKLALTPEQPIEPQPKKATRQNKQAPSFDTQPQPTFHQQQAPTVAQFGGTWQSPDGSYSVVQQTGNSIYAEMFMIVFGVTTKVAWGQGMVAGNQAMFDFIDIYGNSGRSEMVLSPDGQSITGVARYSNGFVSNVFATRSI